MSSQLSVGFKLYAFVSSPRLYDMFLRFDRGLDPLGPLCGFRIFCVIEMTGESADNREECAGLREPGAHRGIGFR